MKALAQRYAVALAEVATEQGIAERLQQEVAAFGELMAASAELRNFLNSPAISPKDKHGVIEKLTARMGASTALRNFLFVLVDNRRTDLLVEIRQALSAELHDRLGTTEAQVVSARELSEKQKAELTRALEKLTGRRVQARYGQDPALIGGAVVRIGSTIYDGSVRAQLERLRARLASE